jgi:autotransporter-associated beta strand protein
MQSETHRIRTGIVSVTRATLALLLAATAATALAQVNTITLTNSDANGISSFASGFGATNWDNGLAPFSGNGAFVNAYYTGTNTLRTPPGAADYIFAGDSLEVTNGGALGLKGFGTITVTNLVLNGGKVSNSGTGGSPDTGVLAGAITVAASSTLDGGGTAGTTALNVLAPMTGAGGITIANNGTVLLSASNSYAGNTTVGSSSALKINAANALPNGPGHGFLTVSGGATSGAVLDLNGFDVTANDLTSGGGVVPAQVINSVVGTTNTLTVDCEFAAGKTFKGMIKDNSGTGGAIALRLVGSTFWTVASNMTYSGDTTIESGRMVMGASTVLPWGPGKGNIIVNGSGILDLQGRSPQMNGLAGNGTVDNFSGNGPAAGGRSTLNCGSNDVSTTFSGVIQNRYYDATLDPTKDYIQISKFGAGTLTLTGTNTYNGNVTVNAGVLRITCQNGDGVTGGGLGLGSQTTPPTKTISISSSTGDAGLHLLGTNGPIVVDASLAFQTAGNTGAIVNEAGNNVINGPISLRTGGATTIRADGDTLTLAGNINIVTNVTSRTLTLSGLAKGTVTGVISDGGSANTPNTNLLSLTKAGAGTWTLAGNNTYSDVTTINGGTLALAASGSLASTPAIILQSNATFDVSAVGGWSLGAAQSLKGNGAVAGNVTANGTVSPGASIGALIFSNQLILAGATLMKLNRTNAPANADLITAATLVRGGTLTVTNIGDPLQAGDTFTLFSAASSSGAFSATNLPPLSAGLAWVNTLAGNGKLSVVSTAPPSQPHLTGISLAGANVIINGTNGAVGRMYVLLHSTNVALPLSQWTPLATNTFTTGNFGLTNPVAPAAPQNFFILHVQ